MASESRFGGDSLPRWGLGRVARLTHPILGFVTKLPCACGWTPDLLGDAICPLRPLKFAAKRTKDETCYACPMDEGRKRVLLIAASILAARKLAQYDSGVQVPATVSAIADAVRWAERIMEEIDRRHPAELVRPQVSR